MTNDSIIYNRIKKNYRKLAKFLKKEEIDAFRLYEKDIPEYPFIIDIYSNRAVIYEKGKKLDLNDQNQLELKRTHLDEITSALRELLEIKKENIHIKERNIQKGKNQYEKLEKTSHFFYINEGDLKFRVNLHDYLDTGLFLDHRPLRKILRQDSTDLKVLNLFAYTGSLSVACAKAGAIVTTVDMSKTYIEWAKENFKLNHIDPHQHKFTQADALKYIDGLHESFDLILLDPPSFSNSKRMKETFNVQDFHEDIILKLMKNLNQNGKLYFSNNYTKFKISDNLSKNFKVQDITYKTIPQDFRNKKIHQCFLIEQK